MWLPKWYWEIKVREINELHKEVADLKRRIKNIEVILLKDAKYKTDILSGKDVVELSENEENRYFC